MNFLIPMAGPDEAFKDSFAFGKSLAEIEQRPVIEHVVERLSALPEAKFVFVIRKEDARRNHLDTVLKLLSPSCTVIIAESQTAGAACTALLAIEHIDPHAPLVITNGDQLIDVDVGMILASFYSRQLDAGVIVFDAVHPRWSYVRVDSQGNVVEAAEKRPISRNATAGFYYFKTGSSFITAAQQMILKDDHVGGAFYVCPCLNQLILSNARIGTHVIPRSSYHSLATPRGVDSYQELISGRGVEADS